MWLVSISTSTATTQFAYNGLGDRTSKSVAAGQTTYLLDQVGLTQVLAESTAGQTTTYLSGLAQFVGSLPSYQLPDALGSVRQVTDNNAQVSLAQSYDPFGNLLEQSGSGVSGFGYTGEQEDASTGLVFLRARYYDPGMGRFVSKDPFPGHLLQPQTQNLYAYVTNNPIRFTDPLGYDGGDPEISPYEQFLIDFFNATTIFDDWSDGSGICLGVWCSGGRKHNQRRAKNWHPYMLEIQLNEEEEFLESAGLADLAKEYGVYREGYGLITKSDGFVFGISGSISVLKGLFGIGIFGNTISECWQDVNTGVGGWEVVYDFRHQQKANFTYSGSGPVLSISPLSVEGGVGLYYGRTFGFRNSVLDYEGGFQSLTFNLPLPLGKKSGKTGSVGATGQFAWGINDDGSFNPDGVFAYYRGMDTL